MTYDLRRLVDNDLAQAVRGPPRDTWTVILGTSSGEDSQVTTSELHPLFRHFNSCTAPLESVGYSVGWLPICGGLLTPTPVG